MDELRATVRRVAESPYAVLVTGESDELVEAELFGYARGAFTGAVTEHAGLFEAADRGTLFLDEIGELSTRAQAKLLRALQDGEIRRIGENVPRRVDVRVVAATNRPLEADVLTGRFREDLLYRVDVLRIVVPPLRRPRALDADRVGRVSLAGQCPAAGERHRLAGRARAPLRGRRSVHIAWLYRGRHE